VFRIAAGAGTEGAKNASGCFAGWNLPAEQEKVSSAEAAAAGLQEPVEESFDRVAYADASELDGSAMGAAWVNGGWIDHWVLRERASLPALMA
jgi:hypothetical protein